MRPGMDEKSQWMPARANNRKITRSARIWICAVAGLAMVGAGCAGPRRTPQIHKIDRVSRSGQAFFAFLNSPGRSIDEIRELLPSARVDSVFLIDENVTNEELGEYIEREACDQPFEIFLRVTVSTDDQRVYRYIVKGDWRSVKMGYGSLRHRELYDAIYLHTHPKDKRIIPNSISDYIHAESFRNVSTLLVGNGIPIEFESIKRSEGGVDHFKIDGREFSLKRPKRVRVRSKGQLRHRKRDAEAPVRELDRIFTEYVEAGRERVTLRNSDGMLITYERNRALSRRLNEVYREAGVLLPTGGDSFAAQSDITPAAP
jgi:hypothetical protein